jgi:hypothetical protein
MKGADGMTTVILLGLCAVACPVLMFAMMRMGRQGGSSPGQAPTAAADPAKGAELARLRAEIDQLKAGEADRGEGPARQYR